jgi:hypothetical protein
MNATLDDLRRRIRAIEGHPVEVARTVDSGLPSLDAAVGGLPCPGLVGVEGPRGSGGTRLALTWAAQRTQAGERVAWIDPEGLLHPPTAAALGVRLERLLIVRAAEGRAAWAVEQALRSSCFGLVVLAGLPDLLDDLRALRAVGPVWVQAARQGSSTLVVLADRIGDRLPLDLRLALGTFQGPRGPGCQGPFGTGAAIVQRRRGAVGGQRVVLPSWPSGLDPWCEGPSWG